MARRGSLFTAPFRALLYLSKGVLATLFVLMLVVNLGMVMVPAVFAMVSGAVESVVGARTVRSAQTAEVENLKARNANLASRADTLAAENARLATELENTRVTYRGDRMLAKEAVSDTSDRIASRVRTATARNTASMAGEALPFIGVAVIVGATAWEVHDACQMMKDLHELDVSFNPENAVVGAEVCGTRVPTAGEVWATILESPGAVWDNMTGLYDGLAEMENPVPRWYNSLLGYGQRVVEVVLDQAPAPAVPEPKKE